MKTSFFTLLVFFLVNAANASSINISPVSVSLDNKHPLQTITIKNNNADNPFIFEAKAYYSDIKDGKNLSTKKTTADLIITPPSNRLLPQQANVIRIALHNEKKTYGETLYSLRLKEITSQADAKLANNHHKKNSNVSLALEANIPVFVYPVDAKAKLIWDIQKNNNLVKVRITNLGNSHLEIKNIDVYSEDTAKPLISKEINERLFVNASGIWELIIPAEKLNQKLYLKIVAGNKDFVKIINKVHTI
ncbi:MAG: hypothetical protein A2X78_04730 [Gammaproteobacteria bacterium GWE2_37_16]|nr:MAG: hypothetical protein A2X78_04730 [Gammaproteobacteria bacterium GWE2_37_16]